MSVPVFRKGVWIEYPKPICIDTNWSQSHLWRAASFYATALSQGYDSDESCALAECFVNKEVYPDLQYGKLIERKLYKITQQGGE
jgi:hypothetical protein